MEFDAIRSFEMVDKSQVSRYSLDVYSLDTIKKAAYKFTDKVSFDFRVNDGFVEVSLVSNDNKLSSDEVGRISQELSNEILDQDLRKRIAEETEDLRNLILAQAFSKTDLLNN